MVVVFVVVWGLLMGGVFVVGVLGELVVIGVSGLFMG